MRANAKYVREGAMGYINAEEFYGEVRDAWWNEDFYPLLVSAVMVEADSKANAQKRDSE